MVGACDIAGARAMLAPDHSRARHAAGTTARVAAAPCGADETMTGHNHVFKITYVVPVNSNATHAAAEHPDGTPRGGATMAPAAAGTTATMNAEARKTKLKNKHKKDKERKRAHKEAAERCGCDEANDVKPAVLSNGGASDAVKGGNGIVPSMIPPSHGVCQIAVAATLLPVPPPAPLSSEVAVMGK